MAYLGPQNNATELPLHNKNALTSHPLSPLTALEITTASQLLKACYPSTIKLQFKAITLQEPEKEKVIAFLDAEHNGTPPTPIKRRAFVPYYIRNTVRTSYLLPYSINTFLTGLSCQDKFHEAVVNLTDRVVERNVRLGDQVHGSSDGGELLALEKVLFEDADVQKEIEKLKLPEGTTVVSDPWIYGNYPPHHYMPFILLTGYRV